LIRAATSVCAGAAAEAGAPVSKRSPTGTATPPGRSRLGRACGTTEATSTFGAAAAFTGARGVGALWTSSSPSSPSPNRMASSVLPPPEEPEPALATWIDEPPRRSTSGGWITYITDPWGTRIEIVQRVQP